MLNNPREGGDPPNIIYNNLFFSVSWIFLIAEEYLISFQDSHLRKNLGTPKIMSGFTLTLCLNYT